MPVDADRLVGLIRDGLPADKTVGVALSGGGDSTALLHLCLQAGLKVEAVTVDHQLRRESSAEAASVGGWCKALGVRHEVQVWQHGAVAGNLMDQARRARMRLIQDWAADRGIAHVALGHTRDDQAETFVMGLGRAAGLAGLSGMRRLWDEGGVRWHRPLLDAGRGQLRDWLRDRGTQWIDDPTNEDDRFSRVKARKVLAVLRPLGITTERLAEVAANLARAQAALTAQVALAAGEVDEQAGSLQFRPDLFGEPAEVQRQVLLAALRWLTGAEYAPRSGEVGRLLEALASGRDATLAGCRARGGWLMRELRAVGGPVPVGAVWDGRWRVAGPEAEVRALGAEGLRQVRDWRETGLAREVLLVTPGVWRGDDLLAAPLAGRPGTWQAKLDRPFHLFRSGD